MQFQKQQNDFSSFPRQIIVIQVYVPFTDTKEAKVD